MRLTLTAQGKRKWLRSWNLSKSYSLTPQSLLHAMKRNPLLHNQQVKSVKWEINRIQKQVETVTLPGAVVNINGINDSILIMRSPHTKAYAGFIQGLK